MKTSIATLLMILTLCAWLALSLEKSLNGCQRTVTALQADLLKRNIWNNASDLTSAQSWPLEADSTSFPEGVRDKLFQGTFSVASGKVHTVLTHKEPFSLLKWLHLSAYDIATFKRYLPISLKPETSVLLTTEVRSVESTGKISVCLILGSSDSDVFLCVSKDAFFTNGSSLTPTAAIHSPGTLPDRLSLLKEGDRLRLFINGHQVIDRKANIASTTAGIAFRFTAPGKAEFVLETFEVRARSPRIEVDRAAHLPIIKGQVEASTHPVPVTGTPHPAPVAAVMPPVLPTATSPMPEAGTKPTLEAVTKLSPAAAENLTPTENTQLPSEALGAWLSFESKNYPSRYLRHQYSRAILTSISQTQIDLQDATFQLTPGLANTYNKDLISFRSANYPGRYLRHRNYELWLDPEGRDDLSRNDATFRIVQGLGGSEFTSFESINYPGYYIRHRESRFFIDKFDGTNLFRDDASFRIVKGLWDVLGN